MHAGLKACVALRYAAGRHEVSLTCYLPTFSTTPAPAPKRRCHRCDQAVITVAPASRSMSINMPPPDTRAAATEKVVPEPVPALPPMPRPLPVLLVPLPTPGPLVDTPMANMADTCNVVSPQRTRKAKRRCEVELLRREDKDGELHLSPFSCEPRSLLHAPPTPPSP